MKKTQSEKSDIEYRNSATNRIVAKIIPFPGVSINTANNTRPENTFTNFLNELGYVENKETPDQLQNDLDAFLREMGLLE